MRAASTVLTLCVTALLFSIYIPIVLGQQPTELIKNGGFETGDFSDWDADSNCKVLRGSYYKYARSGEFYARVGTHSSSGTLSQTCKIPAKSAATLSFWYSVEKGCTLEARLLKSKDGSVVRSWRLTGEAWKSARLDLDLGLANEEVTVEFTGTGHEEVQLIPYRTPYGIIYMRSYDYYYACVDDVSLVSKVVAYEVKITISGLPGDLSTKVLVDGEMKDRAKGEQAILYTFRLGESHAIEVEQSVAGESGVRYYCASNSASFSSDSTQTFTYVKQYFLKVESAFGSCRGEGWYNDGENAGFSIDPTSLPMSGLFGSLGAKYVFDRWGGDLSITSAEGTILVNGPKRVSAIWREDYSQPTIILILSGIFGGSGAFLSIRYARKGKTVRFKQIFKGVTPAKEEAKPTVEPVALPRGPPPEKVSDKAERERYLKRLDELKAQGKISEKVYERLKKKYQIQEKG